MKQNNNIPQGYKDSLLGIIPKEWRVKRIRDILTEGKLGGNYENSGNNGGVPVIKMGNLDRGKINTEKIEYLPQDCTYSEDDILKRGDLLFNTRNSLDLVGKVAIWNNELLFAVYNSNILRLSFDTSYIHSNMYMNFVFNSHYGLSQLRKYATGTTSVAAIYSRDLYNMRIICPPLHEQQKIAETLSCWDFAIEKQTMLIKMLETRKRGLMQQLLTGKKRLNGFEGKWKKKGAGEIFKSISIKGFTSEDLLSATQDKGMIPRRLLEGRVTMPASGTEGFKLVEKGNFVISLRSFQGGLEYSHYRGLVSPAYTVLKSKIAINDEFYRQYFKSYDFIGHLAIAVIGIRDGKQISYDDFCTVKIPCISIEEQTAISNILLATDDEIKKEKEKLEALEIQKKGLMQQLLTGKKRIKVNG